MNLFGAGRRSSRSMYGKLFNITHEQYGLDAQQSVDSITPVAQRAYTLQSLSSPQKTFDEYTKVKLDEHPTPSRTQTSGRSHEGPKRVIRTGFWPNSYKILPHLIASAITIAVIQLSFRNEYWMDLKDPNAHILAGITQGGALNALQLAAKLHELILIASLGNLVTHVAQAHFIGSHGLPLGMLANSFAIGSGDYIRTKAYWSSLLTGKAHKAHYWRFWLLSLLATLLATIVGPSSAIAVIPSLNWFSIHRPFVDDVLPFYIYNQSTVLWPDELTKASTNSPDGVDCVNYTLSTLAQDSCPAGGFRDTYEWAGNLLFANSTAGSNISFPDARGDTRRVLSTQSCTDINDGRASGISLPTFITGALTAYWDFAQNNFKGLALATTQPKLSLSRPIYAARVEVLCNGTDYYNVSEVEARRHVNFPSFDPNKQLPSADYVLPYHSTLNDTTFDWVPMPAGAGNPSIGAAVRVPWEYRLTQNDSGLHQGTEIHACSIYAQWVPVDVFFEPKTSDQVAFTIEGKLSDTCLTIPQSDATTLPFRNMSMSQDYADAINQGISFTDGPVPAILAMLQRTVSTDDRVTDQVINTFQSPLLGSAQAGVAVDSTEAEARTSRATMISTLLAGVITDGIARVAGNGLFPYSSPMFLTNKTDGDKAVGRFLVTSAQGGEDEALNTTTGNVGSLLEIDPVFERYGYGYSWRGSNTTQFGIIVLLIHMAVAISHTAFIIYKVVFLEEGLVSSWTTVSELVALALNSSPSQRLQDTCAGVEASKTWREVVTVRETYPGHLEMVVGPDEKARYPQLQPGRLYGHLDEEGQEVFFDAKED